MEKPKTFQGDLTYLPPALAPLTQEPRWLNWRWEWRRRKDGTGKWTKAPYQSRSPDKNATSTDPSTWGQIADAVEVVAEGAADGIGFALLGQHWCRRSRPLPGCRQRRHLALGGRYSRRSQQQLLRSHRLGFWLEDNGEVANETECHREVHHRSSDRRQHRNLPELRAVYHSEWVGDRALH